MWRFAVPVLISTSVAFGQGSIDLELQAIHHDPVTGVNSYDAGPVIVFEPGPEYTITLFVRAQVVGDPAATGLTTFDGRLTDDGSGSWTASPLTNTDAIGFPLSGTDVLGRTGMTPDYRATIGGAAGNDNPGNGADDGMGGWTFLPLNISPSGAPGAVTGLDDVYRVEWTTTDLTVRRVTLTIDAEGGGYQTGAGLVQTDLVNPGTLVIEMNPPAPGVFAVVGLAGLLALRRRR